MDQNLLRYTGSFKRRYGRTMLKPFLAVFTEKHGTRYFHCATFDDLKAACLKIVKARYKDGVYIPERNVSEPEDDLGMTREQILALPAGSLLRKEGEALLQNLQTQQVEWDDAQRQWDMARRAVENDDGATALWLIEMRSGYEYERFDLEAYD